jgi:hypothetical protein
MAIRTGRNAELADRWFADWRTKDFSWNNLRNFKVTGTVRDVPYNNLEEYWRLDPASGTLRTPDDLLCAGEIIRDQGGTMYHCMHAFTPHTASVAIRVLQARLQASARTEGNVQFRDGRLRWVPVGPDKRAQLIGSILPDHLLAVLCDFTAQNELSADFSWCAFEGRTELNCRRLDAGCQFESCLFADLATFEKSTLGDVANFWGSTFIGDAYFHACIFEKGCGFEGVTFTQRAQFSSSRFKAGAWFKAGMTYADAASFNNAAEFEYCHFEDVCNFDGIHLSDRVSFYSSTFYSSSSFQKLDFAAAKGNAARAFDGCVFKERLDWRQNSVELVSALAGASLSDGILIDSGISKCRPSALVKMMEPGPARRDWLNAFESGCWAVRKGLSQIGEVQLELAAQRLALKARQLQSNHRPLEFAISLFYEKASDFGTSLLRPLVCLFLATVVFAFCYLVGANLGAPPKLTLAEALASLRYSGTRALPIPQSAESTFDADADGCSLSDRLSVQPVGTTSCAPSGIGNSREAIETFRIVVALVEAAQTAIGSALLFVFALAVRRRFQLG